MSRTRVWVRGNPIMRSIDIEVVPLAEVPNEIELNASDPVPLVLIVDDEMLLADTLAAVLASSGLHVVKAYNGTSALEIALEREPDLLLSDVMMPGMNGIELAMAVATELPRCKVLLFSGHASTRDLADACAAGFNFPLMAKPMHPVELLRRVFECLKWNPRMTRGSSTSKSLSGVSKQARHLAS
jgi:CheY-like chemotaxis protein